jgi:hypothetical protein
MIRESVSCKMFLKHIIDYTGCPKYNIHVYMNKIIALLNMIIKHLLEVQHLHHMPDVHTELNAIKLMFRISEFLW